MSLNVDYSSGPIQPQQDQAYAFICRDQNGQVVHTRYGLYETGDPLAGLFAAERAAELALERLDLPDPLVRRNPPGDQLVGLPSWLWVDTPWAPSDVSASVSGVTSTMVATRVSSPSTGSLVRRWARSRTPSSTAPSRSSAFRARSGSLA